MTDNAFISARPRLKLAGTERSDMAEQLTSFVVNLPLHGCAHGELHLVNVGIPEGGSTPDFLFNDINLGDELEIQMGDDDPVTIFKGDITALEEQYGDSQAPTFIILVQDKLHKLARQRNSRSFEDQSPNDLVNTIASDAGLQADADLSALTATWHQLNESDLAFLLRIAARFDIGIRLSGNTLRAKREEQDPSPVQLSPNDSATYVRLIADLNHQATATTVNGYNLADDASADFTSGGLEPAPEGSSAKDTLNNLGWSSDEVVPQPFARSSAEAEAYAKAHFQRAGKRFISGDIICRGEPTLTAGKEINLSNVSERLEGVYQIVHCAHHFDNAAGYQTHLKVNKGGWPA